MGIKSKKNKATWKKPKQQSIRLCGRCFVCKKELYSNEGGWIINAEKKFFCHKHLEKEISCFDKYLNRDNKNIYL
jgi:hypothetical protein|tara:strand:- start:31 stop:255 length:225 start_codon:yes stop_codon:yes gene_type:complete